MQWPSVTPTQLITGHMFWRQCASCHHLYHDLQFSHLRRPLWPAIYETRQDEVRWYLVTSSLHCLVSLSPCNDSQTFNGCLNNISIVSLPMDLAKCLMKLLSFSSTFTSEWRGNDCTGTRMNNWLSSHGTGTLPSNDLEPDLAFFSLACIHCLGMNYCQARVEYETQMMPRLKVPSLFCNANLENASQKLVLWMIGKVAIQCWAEER